MAGGTAGFVAGFACAAGAAGVAGLAAGFGFGLAAAGLAAGAGVCCAEAGTANGAANSNVSDVSGKRTSGHRRRMRIGPRGNVPRRLIANLSHLIQFGRKPARRAA
jgi:hypothetical protein